MIPSVFNGAKQVYDTIGAEISNQTATAHKPEISPEARHMLETGQFLFFEKIKFLILIFRSVAVPS